MAYGPDFITGGTASANSELNPAANGSDNDVNTAWVSNAVSPGIWTYDLGVATTKTARKARVSATGGAGSQVTKDFEILGSNDNSSYTSLATGQCAAVVSGHEWTEVTFSNSTAYRYYRVIVSTNHRGDNYMGFDEVEMFEFTGGGLSARKTLLGVGA
jgi:hypothetical protein